MYCVTVRFEIRPERMQDFMPLMRAQARTSLSEEPGCHRFEVWTDPDRPAQVWLHEVYADRAAFDRHLATPHVATFDAAVAPLIIGKAVETWSVAEAGQDMETKASA